MKRALAIVFLGCALGWGSPDLQAVIVVVDSFDTIQTNTVSGTPSGYKSRFDWVSAAEALGGERDIFVERTSANAGTVRVDVDFSIPSVLSFASGPSTAGRALIAWDGVDGSSLTNFTGLGGLNFYQGGTNDAFLIRRTSDLGASMTIRVYTDGANYSEATISVPADPTFTFSNEFLYFTNFSIGAGSGADFANVGAVTMLIDGTGNLGTDVAVEWFSVVPEPASAVLGLLGACAFLAHRRRQRA
jgi:MYXO-CTERM domain-containing protein